MLQSLLQTEKKAKFAWSDLCCLSILKLRLFFLIDSDQYVPQSNGTEFPCPLTKT